MPFGDLGIRLGRYLVDLFVTTGLSGLRLTAGVTSSHLRASLNIAWGKSTPPGRRIRLPRDTFRVTRSERPAAPVSW
ncbi:hypothetical protein GCM10009779_07330 [Polymorphospora rubra]|uniref:Uncharacterized protein n=1 Tax=Polymorphospora rubra TaxID=338584 RepID=A0A810N9R6_9ACTN|nr:hypothetical protein Prubr_68310 [Polymorphospora rubra]